jgi:hypothetical protein
VLKAAMPEAEDAGYEFVLTVHDEGVTETPDSKIFSGAALAGMLAKQRSWTTGLPLAAAGSEMYRYHKED